MRHPNRMIAAAGLVALFFIAVPQARGQWKEEAVVKSATTVLDQAMAAPGKAIPRAMLADAEGVAIIPDVIKGGLVVGARYGEGVLLVRDAHGNWQAPVFISLTGGNVGWQIGVQASDLVLVFKTPQSVEGIMAGKFTIGGDIAAAAGPVGRETAAATDGRLKAEIYTYSRTRGLFAGVSIDGSVIQLQPAANARYYQPGGPAQPAAVPASGVALVQTVARYADGPPLAEDGPQQAAAWQPLPLAAAEPIHRLSVTDQQSRAALARHASVLRQRLDPQWNAYLALPSEITSGAGHPPQATLEQCLARYEAIAQDAKYQKLSSTAEFQQVHAELRRYVSLRAEAAGTLQLPPPPRVE